MWRLTVFIACGFGSLVNSKIDGTDFDESGDLELDSGEHIGPSVTQVYNHPYAATILKNGSYECSAVILNSHWLLTLSKCFDPDIISTYVSHKKLSNFTVRTASSYNMKGGSLHKIIMLINNFDLKVSAAKLEAPLVFGSRVQPVQLPNPDEEVTLGHLASIIAWTPDGHIRFVNVPVIEASICDDNTKLLPGHYICVGGVQDANRNFCRKDNGGAVIQNSTLIAIATFFHACAIYTRPHAFPKVSSFARWLDSVIWDENNRPTLGTTASTPDVTRDTPTPFFVDPSKFMLTLPYDPVNVPLEPNEDNAVMPRVSLYESYLQNIMKAKTSTQEPRVKIQDKAEVDQMEWFKKYGKAVLMMPQFGQKNFEQYDYDNS